MTAHGVARSRSYADGYRPSSLPVRKKAPHRQLLGATALSTAVIVGSAGPATAEDLWKPEVRAVIGADHNGARSGVEGFAPLVQSPDSVLFLDLRVNHDFRKDRSIETGLGVRRIVNPDLMVGAYGFLSLRDFGGKRFGGATVGVEAIGSQFDAHANLHIPFTRERDSSSVSSSLSFVANRLVEQVSVLNRRDFSMWGIEGEFGAQAPVALPEGHGLRLHVGGYHFWDPGNAARRVTGGKAGFEYSISDVFNNGIGASLSLGGEVRHDNRHGTNFVGTVRLSVPLGGPEAQGDAEDDGSEAVSLASEALRKRANERVRGDIGLRIETDTSSSSITRNAINPATNAEYGLFFFADGGNTLGLGTIGDPTTLDDAITDAGPGGFVVALGGAGNLTTPGATLLAGQTLIGGGQSIPVALFSGGTTQFGLGGSDGTIQGTNPAANVIALANNTTVRGVSITGGASGLFGNNVANVLLSNVTVTGAGANGAAFTGNSSVTGQNFTATGNGGSGLQITGNGTYNFLGTTTLSGNTVDGLNVTGNGSYSFATLNALNNLDDGIDVTSVSGRFSTTGGAIAGNGDQAIKIDPVTVDVVFDSITHSGGSTAVLLDDISGSFRVTGATTISGTAGAGIVVSNSSASVSFDGGTTITNSGDDGISLTGNSGGITFLGTTSITNPGAGAAAVDIEGSNGAISFSSLQIGLQTAGSTGLDLTSATVNSPITATDFDLTSTTAVNTVGVRLVAATGTATVRLGDTAVLGASATIGATGTAPATGVLVSAATSLNFVFGDGEAGIDVGSSINAVTPVAATDSLPFGGTYNFLDATLTGDTSNLSTTLDVYYVDVLNDGINDGSRTNPGTIAGAMASSADVIVLIDRTGADVIDTNDAFQGGLPSLLLDPNQRLMSFRNGDTLNIGGGAPANFLLTGINAGFITNPFAGTGAPTLTSTGAGSTVTLGGNNLIQGVDITSGGAFRSIAGTAVATATVRDSAIGSALFTGMTGTVTLDNTTLSRLDIAGGSVAIVGTGATITNAAAFATIAVSAGHTGSMSFDAASTISATNGSGLQFDNADGTYTFNGTTTLNGGDAGIDIVNGSAGTFFFATGATITSPTGTAFNVDASNATVTYNGTITQNNAATAVAVSNNTGGSVTFGGNVTATTSTATAVLLSNNVGPVSFNAGLQIVTTTGTGLRADTAGTVNVAATAGAETITSSAGQAVQLDSITAGIALDSVSSTGGASGISLLTVGGSFAVAGTTTVSTSTGDGISIVQSTATVTFGGPTSVTNSGGIGILLQDSTGVATFNGTTTLINPAAAMSALAIKGSNGAITINKLVVALQTSGTTGLDASSSVLAGDVRITDFDLTSTTAVNTIGIDVSGVTSPTNNVFIVGDTANTAGGQSATIAGVHTGVLFSSVTNVGFTFGDGEASDDVASSINAVIPIRASDALPTVGLYNFRDVTLIGDTTNLQTNLDIYYVDNVTNGDGSRANPGSITSAMASVNADVIVLLDRTGADTITVGAGSLLLDANQRLMSFRNGDTINVGGGAPVSFLLTGITGGEITNPFAGTGTAPLLTANAGFNVVTLASSNLIEGVRISSAATDFSVFSAANGGTIRGSAIGGVQLTAAATGTVTIENATLSHLSVLGGNVNVSGTGTTAISNGANNAAISVAGGHTGTLSFLATTTIGATAGSGLQFDNADGTYDLLGNNTLTGTSAGINIVNGSGGTFRFGTAGSTTTSITSPTGVAFNLANSTAGVTYTGNLTQTANNFALVSVAGHSGGTVIFQNGTLNATAGSGLQFENADGAYQFNGTTTIGGGASAGVNIFNGSAGTFTFGNGAAITSPTGIAFRADGGAANVTYNGTITQNSAFGAVSVSNNTGGTITFNGLVTASTSTANALNFSANPGSTLEFRGGLNVSTTTGTGLLAQNGGTVTIAATAGTEDIVSSAGTALSLNNIAANIVLDDVSGSGGNAISLSLLTGSLSVTGTTGAATTVGAGISVTQSSATISFNQTTVSNTGGDGIFLSQNTGAVSFLGTTTVTNPGTGFANSAAVDVELGNAAISFDNLQITLGTANTIGLDLNGATLNGNIIAGDFDVDGGSLAGTLGIDLSGTTGTGTFFVRLGDINNNNPGPAGQTSRIFNVAQGVLFSAATDLGELTGPGAFDGFFFGDGAMPAESIITTTGGLVLAGTLPTNGSYNFIDAVLTGDTSNLSSGLTVYYVDDVNEGANDGSASSPGSIANAILSGRDVIVLVNDTDDADGIIDIASAMQGNGTTLTLANGQRLYSFAGGNTINIGGGAPANFKLTGISTGSINNPGTGTPTLTTTAGAANTITLNNNNIILGVIANSGTAGFAVAGSGFAGPTITDSQLGGLSLSGMGGTAVVTNSTFTHWTISGGTIGITATDVQIASTTAAHTAFAVVGGHSGAINFTDTLSTISQTGAAAAVFIDSKTTGNVTFGGLVSGSTANAGTVLLTGNTGNTIAFNGGVQITTTSGTGFSATGGGTVTVAGATNTISASGGMALELSGVTANLTLQTISSAGGLRGIHVSDVDNSSIAVTGTVTATAKANGGAGVLIENSDNTTFTVGGLTTVINNLGALTVAHGVDLQNNAGSTFNFNGGVNITVNGNNAFGFRAQSSGTVNISDPGGTNQITSIRGTALLINPTTVNITLSALTSSGGANGISLTGMSGSLTIGTVTINGQTGDGIDMINNAGTVTINGGTIGDVDDPAGIAVDIEGGTGNVTINASVTKTTAGDLIEVTGRTTGTVSFGGALSATAQAGGIDVNGNSGGTISFTNASKVINTSATATTAVSLVNNTGATIEFTGGGLDIDASSGTGFNATGGGTVIVTGAGNSIQTTTGVAVNLGGIIVHASGINFASTTKGAGGTSAVIMNGATGSGTVALGGGTLAGGSSAVIRVGDGAGGANTGGTAGLTYSGTISNLAVDGSTGRAVDIQDRAAGAGNITLSGNITHNVLGQTGIFLDGNAAGTITFSGQTQTITTDGVTSVSLTNNSGADINFTPGAGGSGFDIAVSGNATGFVASGGGTITITGSSNSVASTGFSRALAWDGVTVGAGDVSFASLSATGNSSGIAVSFNNVDGPGTVSTNINVSATNGVGAHGLSITGGSAATFSFANVTVGSADGNSVNLDGANGTVTISNIGITGGDNAGVFINGNTNAVSINGGSIGSSDDPAGVAVDISGGTANVTVAAAITKTTAGNIVRVTGRTAGTVTISGNLSATGGVANGIDVNGNSGTAVVTFSGGTKTLTTGASSAITLANNTGAAINFTGGGLGITTTSGAGFSAATGGTITVSGVGNSISTATGQILGWSGVSVGAGGVSFASMQATGSVAGMALSLDNVDGVGNTFNGGNVSIAGTTGAGNIGMRIIGGSAATFSFGTVVINDTAGIGLRLSGANGAVSITSAQIDDTGNIGLWIEDNTNTVTISGGFVGESTNSATTTGSQAVVISGGAGNVSVGTNIVSTVVQALSVSGRTGGTVDVSGTIFNSSSGIAMNGNTGGTINVSGSSKILNTGATTAVTLNNNTGATINFTGGGLAINTTSGNGFSASGGGTITVQGTGNTITSTTGTALSVVSTNIGLAGLTFQSISANGGTNGIVLNNTGTTAGTHGGLTVTGTGSAGSGGTIQNMTGADDSGATPGGTGIALNNSRGVSLRYMHLHDFTNYAIRGTGVVDFVLADSTINGVNGTNVASPFRDSAIRFDQVTGTVNILRNEISGGRQHNVLIDNQSGTLNLNFLQNNVHNTSATDGDDGFQLEAELTARILANVSNNIFTAHGGDHFNLSLINDANVDLTFNNNDMQGGHAIGLGQGVFVLGANFNGQLRYDISNNGTVADPFVGNKQGAAIFVNKGSGTGTFSGQITNNVIGNPAVTGSGSEQAQGIHVSARGAGGSHTSLINNNMVRQYFDRGIVVEAGEGAPTLNVTVTNNTVSNFADATNSLHGIHFDFGILAGDNAQITIDVRNNLIANAGNEPQGGVDFRMRTAGSNDVFIAGYGGGNSAANAQAFIDAQNPDGTTFSVSQAASGTYNNGPASPLPPPTLPTLPPAPLLAALGGGGELLGDILDGDALDRLVAAAIERWTALGISDEQLAALNATTFEIASLDAGQLGLAQGSRIRLDDDANGNGWFVDATPLTDEEFANRAGAGQLLADGSQAPAGQYDLLTTIMHEMGHVLGHADTYAIDESQTLMYGWLATGERRLPEVVYTPADGAFAAVGAN